MLGSHPVKRMIATLVPKQHYAIQKYSVAEKEDRNLDAQR